MPVRKFMKFVRSLVKLSVLEAHFLVKQ